MHILDLTPAEQRVLGSLIEKRFTTPDQYPLSLNALRLACNQSTNRDPVVSYDEETVRDAAQRLSKYGVARLASGHSSRATKYRHLAEEALGVDQHQLAILGVLLLRGAQTPGELKQRSERMAAFDSLDAVERTLDELREKGYARRIERRPGQKEDRFEQTLGTGAPSSEQQEPAPPIRPAPAPAPVGVHPAAVVGVHPAAVVGVHPAAVVTAAPSSEALTRRVTALETDVADLRSELATVRDQLAGVRAELGALREELGA